MYGDQLSSAKIRYSGLFLGVKNTPKRDEGSNYVYIYLLNMLCREWKSAALERFQTPLINLGERDTKQEENVVIPKKARAKQYPPTHKCVCHFVHLKSANSIIYRGTYRCKMEEGYPRLSFHLSYISALKPRAECTRAHIYMWCCSRRNGLGH